MLRAAASISRLCRLSIRPPLSASLRRLHSKNVLEDLEQRGFIQDITRAQELKQAVETQQQTVYAGVDPTAKALHIGHLIPLMCLLHFQVRGHKIIPLIGGATGLVGDPSGRTTERQPADKKQIEENVVSLGESINKFFERGLQYGKARIGSVSEELHAPKVTSNLDWHQNVTMLEFLQKVGIHVRVNTMLNRESVRARLNSQQGISFTEFTYQLLQAYDFYHLHKHHGCTIQVGGSDQWGNILAGLELIGRPELAPARTPASAAPAPAAFGITTPLLTTASGEKFGKSAGNAVWLDPDLTSVFDFYQYFLKVADADVERYLKLFTLLSQEEIDQVVQEHGLAPEKRVAQRKLAAEVTELVHFSEGVKTAETLTKLLFGSDYSDLKAAELIQALEGDPRLVRVHSQDLFEVPVVKLASRNQLVSSASAARTLVQSRGLYLNNRVIPETQTKVTPQDLIDDQIAVVRAGKDKLLVLLRQD
ncbi:hypothetical protein AX16_002027 [Volvariella volvacea WC 439]|nr:hypothetical protein AX16_002027 [Volvariella volvacea WC 439]